uniref:F-box domain-containing protein n=1 Tax=Meloidogyne hapla TaxID=6305 RepID=A0A1I8AWW2_MELHA
MFNLQTEVKLDILKCCNFNQLISVRQTNRHFNALINEYENELARIKFRKHFESEKFYFKIPTSPKNIKQLFIVRYWLEKLSLCFF